ncbi:MAG: hypothetical protein ACLF0G_03080 [Candidatus Brocadiia bacterium]
MTSRAALLPLAMALLAGCGGPLFAPPPPEVSIYRSPELGRNGRERVLVLPFRHRDEGVSRAVTEAFALELAKTQAFEVISPEDPQAGPAADTPLWDDGGLDVPALVALRRRLNVQALVLGHVTHYRPYDPPVLGLRVQVVSTRSGSVLWGAEACFDAREEGVRALMRKFHGRRLSDQAETYGWRILLDSPRHYAQFVSRQLVATLGADAGRLLAEKTP